MKEKQQKSQNSLQQSQVTSTEVFLPKRTQTQISETLGNATISNKFPEHLFTRMASKGKQLEIEKEPTMFMKQFTQPMQGTEKNQVNSTFPSSSTTTTTKTSTLTSKPVSLLIKGKPRQSEPLKTRKFPLHLLNDNTAPLITARQANKLAYANYQKELTQTIPIPSASFPEHLFYSATQERKTGRNGMIKMFYFNLFCFVFHYLFLKLKQIH